MKKEFKIFIFLFLLSFSVLDVFAQTGSTLAVREISGHRIQKADGNVRSYLSRLAAQSTIETLQQGKYTILLNAYGGQYEIQVYRMVPLGSKRVMSTFASVYKSAIEYSYSYDSSKGEIRQNHYICPPDSLTCWANPGDYASMKQFGWGENYPSKNCAQSVFTSEEYGREYLQASCFPNRDAAIAFAQSFIRHVTGARGM